MSKYIPFTTEQKERAASVDLEEFLRRRGEKLITSGRDKRLASDHSITIRGCEWYDHASEQGGRAISFVKQFYGLSYPEAVSMLLGDDLCGRYPAAKEKEPEPAKPFELPPKNESMRRVYAYLLQKRYIDREILNAFVRKKLIYESCENSRDGAKEYHNAVFVGLDEHGVPRHGHKRGLYTIGKSYRGNIEGSDPKHSFHYLGGDNTLYVFEAPNARALLLQLAAEQYDAIGNTEYETVRLRRLLTGRKPITEPDAELLQSAVSKARVTSNCVTVTLKNGQTIERRDQL